MQQCLDCSCPLRTSSASKDLLFQCYPLHQHEVHYEYKKRKDAFHVHTIPMASLACSKEPTFTNHSHWKSIPGDLVLHYPLHLVKSFPPGLIMGVGGCCSDVVKGDTTWLWSKMTTQIAVQQRPGSYSLPMSPQRV